MQGREIQAQAPLVGRDGFQPRSPKVAERTRLYLYVVSMDDVRYHITLRKALIKTNKRADLLLMQEGDFSEVSREGRPIAPDFFISAYSRFFHLADAEPAHTIEIYYSLASL